MRGEDWDDLASEGVESGAADGLVWATAAAEATDNIKIKRKILFILDLTALEARFRNRCLFGCKAAGGKVLLFYPLREEDGKKLCWWREVYRNRKDRDRWDGLCEGM